jgi:cbb3-type cytochrome oxidase subunit 3
MKKITLMLIIAVSAWAFQPAKAQTTDTAKNHIEVTK